MTKNQKLELAKAMEFLYTFDSYSAYQDALNVVDEYITLISLEYQKAELAQTIAESKLESLRRLRKENENELD